MTGTSPKQTPLTNRAAEQSHDSSGLESGVLQLPIVADQALRACSMLVCSPLLIGDSPYYLRPEDSKTISASFKDKVSNTVVTPLHNITRDFIQIAESAITITQLNQEIETLYGLVSLDGANDEYRANFTSEKKKFFDQMDRVTKAEIYPYLDNYLEILKRDYPEIAASKNFKEQESRFKDSLDEARKLTLNDFKETVVSSLLLFQDIVEKGLIEKGKASIPVENHESVKREIQLCESASLISSLENTREDAIEAVIDILTKINTPANLGLP